MEFVPFPSLYLSAPTSPFGCSPENHKFYSTWSSPVQPSAGSGSSAGKTKDDEFETGWDQEEQEYRQPARASSFSFSSGQVLPLKLPPRLQTSVPTSPTRSLSTRVRNPFAQRCTWNDGFDPFTIALEKVSEETEGRMSISCRVDWECGQEKDSKWVQSQTMVKTHKPRTIMKRLWLGRPNGPMKRTDQPASCKESKMKKVKSVLLRYASLKKETSDTKSPRCLGYAQMTPKWL